MGPDLGMVELVRWITMMFPSMSEYTSIITPLVVVGFSIVNMFSNILPEPGDKYPVPSVMDIDVELRDKGRIVYFIVRLTRRITIGINRIIDSKAYAWFYKGTKFCAKILSRVKGGTSGKLRQISNPKPFKVEIKSDDDKPKE